MDWRLIREALTTYRISPTTLDGAQAILAHAAPMTFEGKAGITNRPQKRICVDKPRIHIYASRNSPAPRLYQARMDLIHHQNHHIKGGLFDIDTPHLYY